MPWGDRYDARGAVAGLVVLVAAGLGLGVAAGGGVGGWLAAVALAAGAMNLTAAVLRRRAGATRPGARSALDSDELRRRLAITVPFVAVIVAVAVVLGVTLGKDGVVPAMVVAVVLGGAMLFLMLRPGARRQR
jgi:hypothetical protein